MQVNVLLRNRRSLSQVSAVVLLAGMAAGCSSQVARFGGGVDDVFTASTANQRAIIPASQQPFPGDPAPVTAAPVDGTYTGSVARSALRPADTAVSRGTLEPPAATRQALAPKPLAEPAPALDATTTGTVPSQPAMAIEEEVQGWSRAGGTQVTVKEGETVYNLSRRFGVPANIIMKVNGISEAQGLKTGQKVVIPTYVYSQKAPVSAPDNNPKVANAKSSRGSNDLPADGAPKPADVAVLPQPPKLKEGEAAPQAATADTSKAKATGGDGTYTVQAGDTLSKIARRTGVSTTALKQANGMGDGLIRIGQKLTIPAGGAVVAAAPAATDPATTGSVASAKPAKAEQVAGYTPPVKKAAEKTIETAEVDSSPAPDATGIGRMRWPVRGRVISSYGKGGGKANDGIDIAVPEGTPVKAAENGVVIYAGDGLKDFGKTVLVRHENGLVTVYGHASDIKVQRGQKVKRGDDIALSGMSGNTDAPKLHFEVRKNSAPVDPSGFLE